MVKKSSLSRTIENSDLKSSLSDLPNQAEANGKYYCCLCCIGSCLHFKSIRVSCRRSGIKLQKCAFLKSQQKSVGKNNDVSQILHAEVSLNCKNKEFSVFFNKEICISFNEERCWNKGKEKLSAMWAAWRKRSILSFSWCTCLFRLSKAIFWGKVVCATNGAWRDKVALPFLRSPIPQHKVFLIRLHYVVCYTAGLDRPRP